jgi:protein arginine kinase activator
MKKKCDKCGKPATIYLTEIEDGQKIEKHLCEDCASEEGITVKATAISQLLEDFVLQAGAGPGASSEEQEELLCDVCGLSYSDFREQSMLGCPNDYEAFSDHLVPLLQRAHEGASEHIGKVPHRAGSSEKKQIALLRLRAELKAAVAAENYEHAASLRDQIRQVEKT